MASALEKVIDGTVATTINGKEYFCVALEELDKPPDQLEVFYKASENILTVVIIIVIVWWISLVRK